MRTFSILLIFTLACTGCATHYQRDEPEAILFYLRAPKAGHVQIAASYNDYALQPAKRLSSKLWITRMPRGIDFSYFYLVDGKFFVPDCPLMEKDDFGQANCLFSPMP
jgi:hypothetical protein